MPKSVFKEKWGKKHLQDSFRNLMRTKRIEVAMGYLENRKRVLEVGCSFGTISYYMASKKGCFVDAYEIDGERLRLAKDFFSHKKIQYFLKDVRGLNKQNLYDYIVLLEVIEHIENPYDFLLHLFKLLKPGGFLIISTPNANDYLQSVRNIKLYFSTSRKKKALFIKERNDVKYGDHDDHLYAWTWETLFRLLNRVGFMYNDSDFSDFRPISYGNINLFGGLGILDILFKPFTTNLIFKVQKPNGY